jgi:hypothetical protein
MKRLTIGIILGALLGVVCIIGANIRSEEALEPIYLTAFWYNRVIIGMAIGLTGSILDLKKVLVRGGMIGFVVSFAFYLTTGFNDFVGFFAGIVYGVIIAYILYLYDIKKAK